MKENRAQPYIPTPFNSRHQYLFCAVYAFLGNLVCGEDLLLERHVSTVYLLGPFKRCRCIC